jgi:hypothetical protein
MDQHEITQLTTRIEDLCQNLASVAEHKEFTELLQMIHRPGWTSVAEAMLITGIVDVMHGHTQTLARLKQVLLTGSRAAATSPGFESRDNAADVAKSGVGGPGSYPADVAKSILGHPGNYSADVAKSGVGRPGSRAAGRRESKPSRP